MTRALVVYESIYGDNRRVAEAIATSLRQQLPADVVPAVEAPAVIGDDVALLVVGGPNHAMSMPRQSTRESVNTGGDVHIENTARGLHEWLDAVTLPAGIAAAAYDTRMEHPKFLVKLDHASRTEEKLLKRHGATLVAPAEHFSVSDAKGPLAPGEEDRARQWGIQLAQRLTARASAR
jgi:hypothetical protein